MDTRISNQARPTLVGTRNNKRNGQPNGTCFFLSFKVVFCLVLFLKFATSVSALPGKQDWLDYPDHDFASEMMNLASASTNPTFSSPPPATRFAEFLNLALGIPVADAVAAGIDSVEALTKQHDKFPQVNRKTFEALGDEGDFFITTAVTYDTSYKNHIFVRRLNPTDKDLLRRKAKATIIYKETTAWRFFRDPEMYQVKFY
ncbi:hypothetical protein CDD81_1312 [Ophiocordyceps australis]|uniref:Uncharacterized protein n=1 Tax=Ophiocordyceps australis TaxID=1399860 RepID=A0A2C5Y020_9HYPO|nr:hypothetical protein CDD81_1312 [Ophiocordyceps australis]